MELCHPLPPFTAGTAAEKVRMAENAWNSRDPLRVSLVYSPQTYWRNRNEEVRGREEVVQFLTRKWRKEMDYRLIKQLRAWTDNKIAVRFAYEWHDEAGNWFRSYGNENREFNEQGLMVKRFACINDLPISTGERLFFWSGTQRPADHPELDSLGL
ncbi:nuclear transport factor 2 family protein [Tatumella terrea]|uniref:nuclear transport factor 2 family protein n=1 Tax=Tatumella terrea TaxID=419007 RepID=UPI0031D99A7A